MEELLPAAPIPAADDDEPPPVGFAMTGPTAVDEDEDAAVRAGTSSLDSDADIVAVVDAAVVDVVVVEGSGGREFDDVDEDDASICCSISVSGRARREDVQGCKQLNSSLRRRRRRHHELSNWPKTKLVRKRMAVRSEGA